MSHIFGGDSMNRRLGMGANPRVAEETGNPMATRNETLTVVPANPEAFLALLLGVGTAPESLEGTSLEPGSEADAAGVEEAMAGLPTPLRMLRTQPGQPTVPVTASDQPGALRMSPAQVHAMREAQAMAMSAPSTTQLGVAPTAAIDPRVITTATTTATESTPQSTTPSIAPTQLMSVPATLEGSPITTTPITPPITPPPGEAAVPAELRSPAPMPQQLHMPTPAPAESPLPMPQQMPMPWPHGAHDPHAPASPTPASPEQPTPLAADAPSRMAEPSDGRVLHAPQAPAPRRQPTLSNALSATEAAAFRPTPTTTGEPVSEPAIMPPVIFASDTVSAVSAVSAENASATSAEAAVFTQITSEVELSAKVAQRAPEAGGDTHQREAGVLGLDASDTVEGVSEGTDGFDGYAERAGENGSHSNPSSKTTNANLRSHANLMSRAEGMQSLAEAFRRADVQVLRQEGQRTLIALDHPTLGAMQLEVELEKLNMDVRAEIETALGARLLRETEGELRDSVGRYGVELGNVRIDRAPRRNDRSDEPQRATNDHDHNRLNLEA